MYRFYIIMILPLLLSCHSGNSGKVSKHAELNCERLIYVENVLRDSISYNALYNDSNIFLYCTNSTGEIIVYYAKFDKDAGRYNRLGDRLVRIEMDTTASVIKSIVSIHGGCICYYDSMNVCNIHYFDEQITHRILKIEDCSRYIDNNVPDNHREKRILKMMLITCNISEDIFKNNANGWQDIYSALIPLKDIQSYDIEHYDEIVNPYICKQIKKIYDTTDKLTLLSRKLHVVNSGELY